MGREGNNQVVWREIADGKIPQKLLYTLIPRHSRCAKWYGLPKDHKPLVLLRPIVSACDTPCERVSWLLIHSSSSVEHTRLHRQAPQTFPDGLQPFHHGRVCLYSSIPVDDICSPVCYCGRHSARALGESVRRQWSLEIQVLAIFLRVLALTP